MRHPAKYSKELLPVLSKHIVGSSVLDPFAGTGKLRDIVPNAILLEIEPEWAAIENAIVGDATKMPFKSQTFDTICTSPTYGNRMADHFIDHQKEKKYTRNTYRHCLGRELNKNNSGKMQWGENYKNLHTLAWVECKRVLKPGGIFILNISNHIRAGKEIDVTRWHLKEIKAIGFYLLEQYHVKTRRNKNGANYKNRVNYESVLVFKKKIK